MNPFTYHNEQLFCEGCNLQDLAKDYATPLYIYSKNAILDRWQAYQHAFSDFDATICYAVKANSNLAILKLLADQDTGFDVVSAGEMQRVLTISSSSKIVFSGVAKSHAEIEFALKNGIYCFNVESFSELKRIATIAQQLKITAPVSLRVNPDVDASTHPYISTGLKENKFGIDIHQALEVYLFARQADFIEIKGIDCHIGSQLTDISPYYDALLKVLDLVSQLQQQGIELQHIDLGGGLGVRYQNETAPQPQQLAKLLQPLFPQNMGLILEPGRSIVANSGVLLTKVEYLKSNDLKNFAIVDAGMNDLIRPALYQAWQDILPLTRRQGENKSYDIVGPVCETGDFLGKDRNLVLQEGDLLAVMSSGAYGFTMSSNYNSRPRPAEVLVDGEQHKLIYQRETFADLIRNECYE